MEPRVFKTLDEVPEGVVVKGNFAYWKFEGGVRYMDRGVKAGTILWDEGEEDDDHSFANELDAPFIEVRQ
ncbi:hypothetical protein SEA_JSQUARED_57 [Mycobacterium phage Jsquared]|nr:hypothetical protein SEA_JSQUARED_57 [Mycobacterium phage Jsquared]